MALVMHGKERFLHKILNFVRQADQATSQESPQMRTQFRQKHLIGGVFTGKTSYQEIPQAIFLGTKPCFSVYSLH
jgi:hypothetical protein